MEIVVIAPGLISAVVGVSSLALSELRRHCKHRAKRQWSTAIAVGVSAVAVIWLLTKRP